MSCVYPLLRYIRGDEDCLDECGVLSERPASLESRSAGGVVVISSAGRLFLPYADIGPDGRIQLNIQHDKEVIRFKTTNAVSIQCVEKLLRRRYVIITGGRCGQSPILTFPDVVGVDADSPPCWVSDKEFRQLAIYLTSLPTLEEADCGFVLVIDRRQSTWSSLKAALLHISSFFPGMICACYVLRPLGFLQGTWSGINYKFFQDVIKFKVIFCFSLEELHESIDPEQLTEDLGGSIPHSHDLWISQRMGVERFSIQSRNMSAVLQHFIHQLHCTEAPRDDKVSENVLKSQSLTCNQLRNDLASTTTTGESLLCEIRLSSVRSAGSSAYSPEKLINVTTVERLLLQLDETAHKFETYWQNHEKQTRTWLKKRHFDQVYNECQDELEHLTNRCLETTDIGETADAIDLQLDYIQTLQKDIKMTTVKLTELENISCEITPDPIRKGSSAYSNGCQVLRRTLDTIQTQSSKRQLLLTKWRNMHVKLEQANKWCSLGMELLSSQPLDRIGSDGQLAERYLLQLQQLLDSAEEFSIDEESQQDLLTLGSTAETCSLLQQVVQRFENIQSMCLQRCLLLRKTASSKDRPVLTVMPARAEPLDKVRSRSLVTSSSQRNSTDSDTVSVSTTNDDLANKEPAQMSTKRTHIFSELLSTEHIYVTELRQVVTGYVNEITEAEGSHRLPEELCGKTEQLFGNLAEIYDFHREIMLPRIESCVSNVQAIGFCFVEQKARLFSIYTEYCLNKVGSDKLLEQLGDNQSFLLQCQQQLDHALPLSAYLLKPVQRITKYQLLLRDLLRNTEEQSCRHCLQEALSCMLDTLKCVNDSMYQVAITGFPGKLSELGRLLLHSGLSISRESKKDVLKDLRTKPKPRHLFLYEKMLLVCKEKLTSKSRYIFKIGLQMVQVGLTESVGVDGKRFELWLPSRAAVYTIITNSSEERECWVTAIKKVLMEQLQLLKGQHCRHYSIPNCATNRNDPDFQTASVGSLEEYTNSAGTAGSQLWSDSTDNTGPCQVTPAGHGTSSTGTAGSQLLGSDISSDEESSCIDQERLFQGRKFKVLSNYYSTAESELSVSEGDIVYPLKIQPHGWWLVRLAAGGREGWLPSSYLIPVNKRYSFGSQSISSGEIACEENIAEQNADSSNCNH